MNESVTDIFVRSTSGFLPWIEFGDFRIQSYFVVISFVLCLCAVWIPKRAERRMLPARRALDIFIVAIVGGFLGSRILHIAWEEPTYYLQDPMRAFDFMSGGFVWYGGFFGAAVAIIVFLKQRRDASLFQWLDFFSPVAAFGYAGGRVACVLTGCCFGRVCEWPFPSGPHAHDLILFRFPTQGFAVVWELAAGALLLWLEKNQTRLANQWGKRRFPAGGLFSLWVVLHGAGRIIMESLRADPRGPSLGPLTISMAISLAMIIFGTANLVRQNRTTKI